MPDPRKESLDEIVSHSAIVIADQIQKAAAWAKSEMDLQIEVAGALKEFARRAKITLEVHHNVTVATGRPDSVYSNVIVEYKDPGTLSGNRDAANNKKLIEQIRQRFYDMRREENRPMNSMFGVGTDGKYFVFVRFRDEKWTDQEPLEVNRYSTERFLWALYNLGQKGKPYQPEYLHGDFGSDSLIAQEGVRTLYDEILKTENAKAQVFFNQWKILFGEVCGYDVENLSDKLKKLAEFYGVKGKPFPGQLLFALHTYYALLIKLLAAEIVSFFNPWMTRQVEKLQNATTPAKLRRELDELERGGVFHTMGITNFLEGDLFAWYLPVWNEPIEKIARQMIQKLDDYNPGTFSEDPAQSRDLLKKLYQQLFPKSVRHDLGEYYTPDWLADHVLNELGYVGNPDKRLLDPACGSGTFLVMAINRIRRWYDENREKCAFDEGELLKRILANVIGFDLNPLAVMAARTNYLVAIKDLIRHVGNIEIPIYLCDSIMTPAEHGDLFTGSTGSVAKVPCSAMKPPYLLVPKEIAKSPKEVAAYAETLEICIKNGYSPQEFLARCRDEGLKITVTNAHTDLYMELVRLDKENKNGIWARIIKNNFAPLFTGVFDYVAGNPPWINWESLPEEYRLQTSPLWLEYKIYNGIKKGKVITKDDVCVLMTYSSIDHYLGSSGQLGFLLTQTLFKSSDAGEGFRRFRYEKDGKLIWIKIEKVWDLGPIKPFEGAANRTAVLLCNKGDRPTDYPVPYLLVRDPLVDGIDVSSADVELRRDYTVDELGALPIVKEVDTSPWITVAPGCLRGLLKAIGKSDYRARVGVFSGGLNGCFWIRILDTTPEGDFLVQNIPDAGKKSVISHTARIEGALIYPLIRGRDIKRWSATPSEYLILVNEVSKLAAIPEAAMKSKHPKTYEYLKFFESQLRERRGYTVMRLMEKGPFYAISEVGPYTVAPIKVMWRQMLPQLRMAVTMPIDNPYLGRKVAVTQHVVTQVHFETQEEAFYFCALGNSSIATLINQSYSTAKSYGTPQLLDHLRIPRYDEDEKTHVALSQLGRRAHECRTKSDSFDLAQIEAEIDRKAADLWGLSSAELDSIQRVMTDAGKTLKARSLDDDEG